MTFDWIVGPVPDGQRGILLVVLHEVLLPDGDLYEYYAGEPVTVRWWGHKGKTTFGQWRIQPDWVKKYVVLGEDK